MNIGILGPFPPFRGGISTFNVHLTLHLAPYCQPIPLNYCQQYPRIIFPGQTQLDRSRTPFPIAARPVFAPFRFWHWRSGRRQLAEAQLSLLVLSWWTPIFAPSMYLFLKRFIRKHPLPLLAICHNIRPHERIPFTLFFQKRLLGLMDSYITHSLPDSRILADWFPGRTVRSLFHPVYDQFPVTADLDRPGARSRLGIAAPDKPLILFFGLVRPYKGLSVLLEAFKNLMESDTPLPTLLIAGEFYENRATFEPLLSQLVRTGHVLLHDRFIPNEDVRHYFAAADAVILPYRHATQSGVIPLAYACDRGVVTTRVGGLAEMVEDTVSGILVPPEDPAALAAGIRRFLEHQSEIERNVPRFAQRFGWDHYIQHVLPLAGATPQSRP